MARMGKSCGEPSCHFGAGPASSPAGSSRAPACGPGRPDTASRGRRPGPHTTSHVAGGPPGTLFGQGFHCCGRRFGGLLVARRTGPEPAPCCCGQAQLAGKHLPGGPSGDPVPRRPQRVHRIVARLAALASYLRLDAMGEALAQPHPDRCSGTGGVDGHRRAPAQVHRERPNLVGYLARFVGGAELSHRHRRRVSRSAHRTSW